MTVTASLTHHTPVVVRTDSLPHHSPVVVRAASLPHHSPVAVRVASLPHHSPVAVRAASLPHHSPVAVRADSLPHHSPVAVRVASLPHHSPVAVRADSLPHHSPVAVRVAEERRQHGQPLEGGARARVRRQEERLVTGEVNHAHLVMQQLQAHTQHGETRGLAGHAAQIQHGETRAAHIEQAVTDSPAWRSRTIRRARDRPEAASCCTRPAPDWCPWWAARSSPRRPSRPPGCPAQTTRIRLVSRCRITATMHLYQH